MLLHEKLRCYIKVMLLHEQSWCFRKSCVVLERVILFHERLCHFMESSIIFIYSYFFVRKKFEREFSIKFRLKKINNFVFQRKEEKTKIQDEYLSIPFILVQIFFTYIFREILTFKENIQNR